MVNSLKIYARYVLDFTHTYIRIESEMDIENESKAENLLFSGMCESCGNSLENTKEKKKKTEAAGVSQTVIMSSSFGVVGILGCRSLDDEKPQATKANKNYYF